MKLKDKIKAKLPPLPGGTYPAICIGIADLGDQYYQEYKKIYHKVVFTFEIHSEADGSGRPRQLSQQYTLSLHKKSKLYSLLNSWTNQNMSEQEMRELDLFSLIGNSCLINVSVNEKGYNKIEAVMSMPKAMPPLQSATLVIKYDIDVDGFEGEAWDNFPNWVKDKVRNSKQYQEFAPDTVLPAPSAEGENNPADEKTAEADDLLAEEEEEECPF